jgi:hypothetical protein
MNGNKEQKNDRVDTGGRENMKDVGKSKRQRDRRKTDWSREYFMNKNSTYEEKISCLERKIEELQSHIHLAEEIIERRFPCNKKRPFELDRALRLLKTDDGVSPWNWEDRRAIDDMADENLLENIQEFYAYLQGIKRPKKFADNLQMPELSKDLAWNIIYVLQEGLQILPDHIERCDNCGELFDDWSSGRYSELEGKHYCNGCYDKGNTNLCDRCGEEVWVDEAWNEDAGQYLCDECKEKIRNGIEPEEE